MVHRGHVVAVAPCTLDDPCNSHRHLGGWASRPLYVLDPGVERTHSRPHASNDNPYSEAQFKTMKYRPEFPDRFGSKQDAAEFTGPFVD